LAVTVDPRVWLERAILLIVIGLIVQMFCLIDVTPASFLLFASAGLGPVFIGLVLFGVAVAKSRRLAEEQGDDAG
jgi:hypothetical protein